MHWERAPPRPVATATSYAASRIAGPASAVSPLEPPCQVTGHVRRPSRRALQNVRRTAVACLGQGHGRRRRTYHPQLPSISRRFCTVHALLTCGDHSLENDEVAATAVRTRQPAPPPARRLPVHPTLATRCRHGLTAPPPRRPRRRHSCPPPVARVQDLSTHLRSSFVDRLELLMPGSWVVDPAIGRLLVAVAVSIIYLCHGRLRLGRLLRCTPGKLKLRSLPCRPSLGLRTPCGTTVRPGAVGPVPDLYASTSQARSVQLRRH